MSFNEFTIKDPKLRSTPPCHQPNISTASSIADPRQSLPHPSLSLTVAAPSPHFPDLGRKGGNAKERRFGEAVVDIAVGGGFHGDGGRDFGGASRGVTTKRPRAATTPPIFCIYA
ncbi:hypothetical protein Acr_03g0020020 [Actinidia rufa]|uniref:Uncharacterized protein n=1 Tax=Actinidia rufa TaxID=165716 RepID=A0A7J0EFH3_9ERIC|nr:hypothetical protein Acr_03g0020020 [Actinidia rufa]